MPTVTVTELVDRAKAASDMRDNFVTPTQWLYWASQERLALDLFLARSGWTQGFSTFNITVTGSEAGNYPVNPTGGVMAIVCVYQYDTTGRIKMLEHQDPISFLKRVPGYVGSPSGHANYYSVRYGYDNGTLDDKDMLTLQMYPEPSTGETYRVLYIPHPKKLVISSPSGWQESSVSYPMGWEERIVLGMARRALIKEESETRGIDSEIGMWDSRIEEACWDRVIASSPSVRNVDQTHYSWLDRLSIPPHGTWIWV